MTILQYILAALLILAAGVIGALIGAVTERSGRQ